MIAGVNLWLGSFCKRFLWMKILWCNRSNAWRIDWIRYMIITLLSWCLAFFFINHRGVPFFGAAFIHIGMWSFTIWLFSRIDPLIRTRSALKEKLETIFEILSLCQHLFLFRCLLTWIVWLLIIYWCLSRWLLLKWIN